MGQEVHGSRESRAAAERHDPTNAARRARGGSRPVDTTCRLRTGLRRVELDDATASLDGIEQALVVRQLQDLALDRRLVGAVHARHVARHACRVGLWVSVVKKF